MSVSVFYQSVHTIEINDQLLSLLQPQRREQLLSFRSEMDRKRCGAAGLLLWEHLYHGHPENYTVSYNKTGKPHVCGAPFFNLSHSGDFVMLALSDTPVGCDIERPRKSVLSHHVFHPRELDLISGISPGEKRDRQFLKLWTAKEAFLKALGTGIQSDANTYDLSSSSRIQLADGSVWQLAYDRPPDAASYTACVCFRI